MEAQKVVRSGVSKAVSAFFEYDTPKVVHIQSKKVGVINRIIQLLILAYIIGYAIVWEKGYQETDTVTSAALTKLKGVQYVNISGVHVPGVTDRVWDVADYVVPPQEVDAFFVTTNVVLTQNQTQSTCDEDPNIPDAKCLNDSDCHQGVAFPTGNGVQTGACVNSTQDNTTKTCEIYAWCPVEVDKLPVPEESVLENTKNFTVMIKNWIEFTKFKVKRRNIIDSINNKTYLQTCRYKSDDPTDQFCPIFELNTIVEYAGQKYDEMAVKGGVISIEIIWNCDLDHDISQCRPKYSFSRLDDQDAKLAPGWNFRYANYYYEGNTQKRDLIKATGIRFIIKVSGTAGKFSIVPLLLNLGSGLGLLAIATVLCDIIVMYLLKRGAFYKEKKYQIITDDDAFQGFGYGSMENSPEQPRRRGMPIEVAEGSFRSEHSNLQPRYEYRDAPR